MRLSNLEGSSSDLRHISPCGVMGEKEGWEGFCPSLRSHRVERADIPHATEARGSL